MPKARKTKQKKVTRAHWADLASETSFPIATLEVLEEHHATLNTFCADTYTSEAPSLYATAVQMMKSVPVRVLSSFHQYCVALSTLIHYGSAAQQFGYLYHTYAASNERGIDRSELFQLLEDHSERVTNIVMKDDKLLHVTDPRHFDKLYTWLKKHFILYDETRCGFLPENLALAMIEAHPTALAHLKFQLAPFIKMTKEGNARYANQVAAAGLK